MENASRSFFEYYLAETMVSGDGGVFGDTVDIQQSSDAYAPGDARVPKVIGPIQRRAGLAKKKRKKKNGYRTLDSK